MTATIPINNGNTSTTGLNQPVISYGSLPSSAHHNITSTLERSTTDGAILSNTINNPSNHRLQSSSAQSSPRKSGIAQPSYSRAASSYRPNAVHGSSVTFEQFRAPTKNTSNDGASPRRKLSSSTPPNGNESCSQQQQQLRYSIDLQAFTDEDGEPVVRFRSGAGEDEDDNATSVQIAVWGSLIVNIVLFVTKAYSAYSAHSLAVAAAAVDSFLDLAAQLIVFLAERKSAESDQLYPVGKSRLAPVGVVLTASLMGFASMQIIVESVQQLVEGYTNGGEVSSGVNFDLPTMVLLFSTVAVKALLYVYCKSVSKSSSTALTLASDHWNDIAANLGAVITGLVSNSLPKMWYADAVGAIVMSIYIARNWMIVGTEQISLLVGKTASPAFVDAIKEIAEHHHDVLTLDSIRAYSFGQRFLVELEVVLPADMMVAEAHDIALDLQMMIEQLNEVERCFVHIDHLAREEDEHNSEWVAQNNKDLMQRIASQLTPSNRNANISDKESGKATDKTEDNNTLQLPSTDDKLKST